MHHIPKFVETFPELSKVSSEEMCERWRRLGIEFYTEVRTPVNLWMRFTLPFALLLIVLMFISLPFNFMVTGKWGYSLSKKNRVYNWFKSLGF